MLHYHFKKNNIKIDISIEVYKYLKIKRLNLIFQIVDINNK